MRPCDVCGAGRSGGRVKGEKQEAGGCWERTRFVLKGSDDLNFRLTVKRG